MKKYVVLSILACLPMLAQRGTYVGEGGYKNTYVAVFDQSGKIIASGCLIVGSVITCGNGTAPSAIVLPELAVSGHSTDSRIYGQTSQASNGCFELPVGNPSSAGQVIQATATTDTLDGRTCVQTQWANVAGTGSVLGKTIDYSLSIADCNNEWISFNGANKTFTFANPPPSNSCVFSVQNLNSTALAFTVPSGPFVNGSATFASITQGQAVSCYTDGTNYFCSTPFTAEATIQSTRTEPINDLSPATADDGLIVVLNPANPIHLTRVSCGTTAVSGTAESVVMNLVTGGASLISDLTATHGTVNQVVTTTFANGSSQCGGTTSCAVAAHAPVTLHVGTITGTPSNLACAVDYTVD